jgi:peptidoglycan L-alanyl-D-glutamate endopeptidase CwlK
MSIFKLSERSLERLEGVNPILIEILQEAIKRSPIDFGIPQYGGLRTAEEQAELFKRKKSKCDGLVKKSYHQSGNAFDIVPYIAGKYSWERDHINIVAGVIMAVAHEKGVNLRWGATFGDKKGLLRGWDPGHFEIRRTH